MVAFRFLLGAALLLGGQLVWADRIEPEKLSRAKTAYLFNIAKFVAWPGDTSAIVLCVHPDSGLQEYLLKLDGRDVGHSRMLKVVSRVDMRDGCNIYYSDEPNSIEGALSVGHSPQGPSAAATQVLTASDHISTLDRGYAVRFRVRNGKLRFQFNQSVLARSSFKVSSKLLVLAGMAGK